MNGMDFFDIALAGNIAKGSGGGGGGTSDYEELTNKPQINGNQLTGNKTSAQLGIEWVWRGTRAQYEAAAATIPPNTFVDITDEPDLDNVPRQGSLNPVTSNGLYVELSKLKVINENPESHNGIYRGKNLTNVYTIEQMYERVHDGSFEDLYLGDYFTVSITTDLYTRFTGSAFESGVTYYEMGGTVIARTWTETQDAEPQSGKVYATKQVVTEDVDLMIAHFDYYLNMGTTQQINDHHVILIAKRPLITTSSINEVLEECINGYVGSDMHNITLPSYAAAFKSALNNHIVVRNTKLPSTINASTPSMAAGGLNGATIATANASFELSLGSEYQFFGTGILSSSWRDVCVDYNKFSVYNFIDSQMGAANSFLLRSFSHIDSNGYYKYAMVNVGGQVSTLAATARGQYAKVLPFMLFG